VFWGKISGDGVTGLSAVWREGSGCATLGLFFNNPSSLQISAMGMSVQLSERRAPEIKMLSALTVKMSTAEDLQHRSDPEVTIPTCPSSPKHRMDPCPIECIENK